jgi:5'(3')-deoxyribonucleotidase
MMKPILGVDIDGVCADFVGKCLVRVSEESQENFKKGLIDVELDDIISRVVNDPIFYLDLPVIRDAQSSVLALSEFYDIWYITSRPINLLLETLCWLRDNKFPNYENIYHSTDKGLSCIALGVVAMVEDQVKYAEGIATWGTKVWLFEQPYNRKVELKSPMIERVHCWNDLLFYLLFPKGTV